MGETALEMQILIINAQKSIDLICSDRQTVLSSSITHLVYNWSQSSEKRVQSSMKITFKTRRWSGDELLAWREKWIETTLELRLLVYLIVVVVVIILIIIVTVVI